MTQQVTYYHTRTPRTIMVGGPFDSLPDELKQKFVAVFYDGLADACSGAATHAAIGTSDQAARQLIRILEIADNPSAMQVIQDVVHELQGYGNADR